VAFSSEVQIGSREENASDKNLNPGSDSIRTDQALDAGGQLRCVTTRIRLICPTGNLAVDVSTMPRKNI